MRVAVKLFGDLVRYGPAGKDSFSCDLRPDPGETEFTIGFLLKHIGIPESEVWMVALNGARVDTEDMMQKPLKDGDQVMIFAPVMGG